MLEWAKFTVQEQKILTNLGISADSRSKISDLLDKSRGRAHPQVNVEGGKEEYQQHLPGKLGVWPTEAVDILVNEEKLPAATVRETLNRIAKELLRCWLHIWADRCNREPMVPPTKQKRKKYWNRLFKKKVDKHSSLFHTHTLTHKGPAKPRYKTDTITKYIRTLLMEAFQKRYRDQEISQTTTDRHPPAPPTIGLRRRKPEQDQQLNHLLTNCCAFNAILQMLHCNNLTLTSTGTEPAGPGNSGNRTPLSTLLRDVLDILGQDGRSKCPEEPQVALLRRWRELGAGTEGFSPSHHHDAHEVLVTLLRALEDENKKGRAAVAYRAKVTIQQRLICNTCERPTNKELPTGSVTTEEDVIQLQLTAPKEASTIGELLAPKTDDREVHCDHCNSSQKATATTSWIKADHSRSVLWLPRLSPHADTNTGEVIFIKNEFKLACEHPLVKGIVCHKGSMDSGHYYYIHRTGKGWATIDDDRPITYYNILPDSTKTEAYMVVLQMPSADTDKSVTTEPLGHTSHEFASNVENNTNVDSIFKAGVQAATTPRTARTEKINNKKRNREEVEQQPQIKIHMTGRRRTDHTRKLKTYRAWKIRERGAPAKHADKTQALMRCITSLGRDGPHTAEYSEKNTS